MKNILFQKDIYLLLMFALILLLMILPLPVIIMDIVVTLNITIAIIILIICLNLKDPTEFSTFPTLILITTVFRLSISVSTTRLILVEGNAGKIIETFGEVVTGNNVAVGLVIFSIITVVQFLVITKGADRVAEVGARFTLDGLPGKQMSVDADVRAGLIDEKEAKIRRSALEKETKLFGAMDGAMKFVKGDSIAGLIITAINLVGGISIGVFQKGLEFSEAGVVYSLMTIGDGLVSQIPALLISISAGTIVTRVSTPNGPSLGTEISQQITANVKTLMFAGIAISAFGFIPGFPTIIFLIIGTSMIYYSWDMSKKHYKKTQNLFKISSWDNMHALDSKNWQNLFETRFERASVKLTLPLVIKDYDFTNFSQIYETVRKRISNNTGVYVGYWRYDFRNDTDNTYEIHIKNRLITKGNIKSDQVFVKANSSYLNALGIECIKDYYGQNGVWVDKKFNSLLLKNNIYFLGPVELICTHILQSTLENWHLFLDYFGTERYLDVECAEHSALVSAVKKELSIDEISEILHVLAKEKIPVKNYSYVLQGLVQAAHKCETTVEMANHVRMFLSHIFTNDLALNGVLHAIIIMPNLETKIRDGQRIENEKPFLVVDPALSRNIAEQVRTIRGNETKDDNELVIITQHDIRSSIFQLLYKQNVKITVLSYQEISPDLMVFPIHAIRTNQLND